MLIPKKDIKKVVGVGVPQPFLNLAKDYDHDKVPNFADCQPYNKKEQGWTHKLGSTIAKKIGAERVAERIKERGEEVNFIRDEARTERYKQRLETAVYREQERGREEREQIKSKPVGSWRSFQSFGKYIVKPKEKTTVSGKRTKRTIYVKKGKRYVKKTVYSKPKQISSQTNNKGGLAERSNNDYMGRISRMI